MCCGDIKHVHCLHFCCDMHMCEAKPHNKAKLVTGINAEDTLINQLHKVIPRVIHVYGAATGY